MKYVIDVGKGNFNGEENSFVKWLRYDGHDAMCSTNSESYVNGNPVSSDDDARYVLNELWDEYCEDWENIESAQCDYDEMTYYSQE